jgi:hypothetical protein
LLRTAAIWLFWSISGKGIIALGHSLRPAATCLLGHVMRRA